MSEPDDAQAAIRGQAAEWHARIESAEMDWEAFAAWLDVDPRHRDAYDQVALLDAEIGANRTAIAAALPANDADLSPIGSSRSNRLRWWTGGGVAIAASLAVLVMPPFPFFTRQSPIIYRTGPAETRTIALNDGSRIVVDRDSQLALNDRGSEIELTSGSAYFDIRHDPARTMVIRAGDYEVRDIGTRFDLARTSDHLAVAVAEGQVLVTPKDGQGMVLLAGKRIDIVGDQGDAVVRSIAKDGVGSWREGRLVYDNSPLALVALDLARYSGRAVSVDPSVADLRMSGVLRIGDGSKLVDQVEALLPIRAVIQGSHIRLVRAR